MKRSDDPALDLRAMQSALGVESDDPAPGPARRAELDEATAYWSDRFAALLDLAEPIRSGTALWERIAADTLGQTARRVASVTEPSWLDRLWNNLNLWRLATAAAVAATIALIVLGPLGRLAPPDAMLVAVLQSPGEQKAGFLVQVAADRTVRLTPLGATPVPAGRALQFWTKADSDAGPTSLGLVKGNAVSRIAYPKGRLDPNQLFEVTLEPETGSPIGRPTGPILFIGRGLAPGMQAPI